VVSPDNRWLYVANRLSDSVSKIDLKKLTLNKTTIVGSHPFGLTIDARGERIYVANVQSDDVTVLEARRMLLSLP